jgi:hypothetical protein
VTRARLTAVSLARAVGWSAAGFLVATGAWAADPRLAARLDPATAAEVQRWVVDTQGQGLPTEPLVSKALEGAAKGAPSVRIVAAVRAQALALGAARAALGDTSSESEIIAGAGAILASVPRESLVSLRATRPGPLVVPLVVLADLVARNVPVGAAAQAVLTASRARARDADFLDLRKRIEQDISAGAVPADAAIARSRSFRSTTPAPKEPKRGRGSGGGP